MYSWWCGDDYFCRRLHFFFCKNCGGRPFIFAGEGEIVDADLNALGKGGEGVVKAWRPKKEGWIEGQPGCPSYLSVNAYTIDANQEGLDLRELVENKTLLYLDMLRSHDLKSMSKPTYEKPPLGGVY